MYIIGAVLEKEQTKIALFDQEYRLLTKKVGALSNATNLCTDILSEYGIAASDVSHIGVAVESSTPSPLAVAANIEKALGIPCQGTSLIGARALGEAYLARVPSLIVLAIEDTVECGIVINEQIFAGMHPPDGNVAHMAINHGGYPCACGRQGCFEAYVSNSGLKRIAAEAGMTDTDSLTPSLLFGMNTPEAECAKELYVKYLASGITNIINLFQTNELVLEGPFTEAGDALMGPMMDIVLREQYSRDLPNKCNIRFSNKETDTSLIGAARLGR